MRSALPVLIAIAGLSLASQVELPVRPVPFTLQTFAVILTGFLLGPMRGLVAVAAWLIAGALGLPLFSSGSGGLDSFSGPTAGYLLSFPFAAALAGWMALGWRRGVSAVRLFVAGILAHMLTLAIGGAWLATLIGVSAAWEKGVLPFLLSAVVKSAAAAAVIKAAALASAESARA